MAFTNPRTWVTGELVSAAMLNEQIRDNTNAAFPLGVDAWLTYTPTLTQNNAAVTKTVNYGRYMRVGRSVFFAGRLTVTGTGTAGTSLKVGLPVAAAAVTELFMGQGQLFDASAGVVHRALINGVTGSASEFYMQAAASTGADVMGVVGFTAALGSGDVLVFSGTYEAAS